MREIFAIAFGGSLGAVARFLVANGIYTLLGRGFPHGTLFVNVSGSFLMGLLTELLLQRFAFAVEYRAAILVGFLGAYTTFSTFALETLYLFEEGAHIKAFLNIFLSSILCLVAVWFGLVWGRAIFANDIYPWLGHGLPYLDLMLAWCGAFLLAILMEVICHYFRLSVEWRAVIFISLLSLLAMGSTLWLILRLSEVRYAFHAWLSVFAVNALCGAVVVWFGTWVGNWLWQLEPSQ